jgi:multiple sugar transport system substrate-binding protein
MRMPYDAKTLSEGGLLRRDFLKRAALAGAAAGPLSGLLGASVRDAWADTATLNVFAPLPPDPAPPGDAKFSQAALASWEQAHNVKVIYEAVAWPQLHDKMATNFASGTHVWDVIYMSGWVPEFLKFIQPFSDKLSPELVADMPKSSFSTVTWNGRSYGAVFTLSLLTLSRDRCPAAHGGSLQERYGSGIDLLRRH